MVSVGFIHPIDGLIFLRAAALLSIAFHTALCYTYLKRVVPFFQHFLSNLYNFIYLGSAALQPRTHLTKERTFL